MLGEKHVLKKFRQAASRKWKRSYLLRKGGFIVKKAKWHRQPPLLPQAALPVNKTGL